MNIFSVNNLRFKLRGQGRFADQSPKTLNFKPFKRHSDPTQHQPVHCDQSAQ